MNKYCKIKESEKTESVNVDKILNKNHNILFCYSESYTNTTAQSANHYLEKNSELLSKLINNNDKCESVLDNANINMVIRL